LRFAVHRPGCPVASPRSHGVPRRDVPGRVHVSVAGETAGSTHKARLTLARPSVHVPARATTLRGVCRFDLLDPSDGLVFQTTYQQAPAGSQDFPVKPGFGPDIAAGPVAGALRGAGHAPDIQVLDADHVEFTGQPGARLLSPVFPLICLACLQPRDRVPHAPTAIRPVPGTGEPTFQPKNTFALWPGQAGNMHQFPSGKGRAGDHAPVDADGLAVARCRDRVRNGGERDVPPACAIQRDPVGPHARWYRPGPAEPNPADLRDPNLADVSGYAAHIPLPATPHNPESFIPPGLSPRRPACWVPSIEECGHRLSEVAKSLLLHRLGARGQPRVLCTSSGELAALLQVARSVRTAGVPVRVLLDCQIPYESGMRAMVPQHQLLGWRRKQSVPRHTNTLATTADISWEATRRSVPCLMGADLLANRLTLLSAVLSGMSPARQSEASARMAENI
jgi:hypothetical protein